MTRILLHSFYALFSFIYFIIIDLQFGKSNRHWDEKCKAFSMHNKINQLIYMLNFILLFAWENDLVSNTTDFHWLHHKCVCPRFVVHFHIR